MQEDGPIFETITWGQFVQEMKYPEDARKQMSARAEGKPRDSVVVEPGRDIFKQRVRVNFEFDCCVNSEPIVNASDDTEAIVHDLALLKSFLAADKEKLLDMMVDCIGVKLGMHGCETFMHEFLPQVNVEAHSLFGPAIDALDDEHSKFWKEVRVEEPDMRYGDILSLYTEWLFKCFNAEFVSSSFQIVDAQ